MKTGNPTLNPNVFEKAKQQAASTLTTTTRGGQTELMTIQGTVNKTAFLLVLAFLSAAWTWLQFHNGMNVQPLVLFGAIGGLILAIVTVFKQTWAKYTAPAYALVEGLFLGGISVFFESIFPGIAMQAAMLTLGVLALMLAIYKTGVIRVTHKFRMGVFAATGGIFLLYLVSFVGSFFGFHVPYIHQGGMIGIGFSLFVVVIAALNLILDFDFIEKGEQAGAPKHFEWYGAFSLMITIVWLYVEMLRLLAKLQEE